MGRSSRTRRSSRPSWMCSTWTRRAPRWLAIRRRTISKAHEPSGCERFWSTAKMSTRTHRTACRICSRFRRRWASAALRVRARLEDPHGRHARASPRPPEPDADGGCVVLVTKLAEKQTAVGPVDQDVGPRGQPGEIEVLPVEMAGVAIRVTDGCPLVDRERVRSALLAVVLEDRSAWLVREVAGGVGVMVGEAEPALAIAEDDRVVRR